MKRGLLAAAGVVIFFGMLLYFTLGLRKHRVEVCMSYQGRSNCAIASGETQENALRTAVSNACALIASGMTDSLACERSQPASLRWLQQ